MKKCGVKNCVHFDKRYNSNCCISWDSMNDCDRFEPKKKKRCEWKYTYTDSSNNEHYVLKCSTHYSCFNQVEKSIVKYCPYCGKKIKFIVGGEINEKM